MRGEQVRDALRAVYAREKKQLQKLDEEREAIKRQNREITDELRAKCEHVGDPMFGYSCIYCGEFLH